MLSKKKPFVDSPSSASQGKDKKLKKMVFPGTGNQGKALPETETAENDEDYEPTAMLGMMSEFQREAGITAPKETVNSSKHHASLSVSTVILFLIFDGLAQEVHETFLDLFSMLILLLTIAV